MGWVVNTTPLPLYPRERPGTHCIEAGWAPRAVWTGTENLAPTRIHSPDRPARSESLYRLNCPYPICVCRNLVFYAVFVNSYMWGVTGRCIQTLGSWTWRRETICSALNVHRRTILKWILKKQEGAVWTGFMCHTLLDTTLCWPCILNRTNNNQHDPLFIFSLLSYHTCTCFGRISIPSSGGRMYICGKWYLLYFWVYCQQAWPDDRPIRPKHVEVW
jgi:hypothetical protein